MAIESKRITFNEYTGNLARIIELVLASGEEILVENKDGRLVAVNPVTPVTTRKSSSDMAAFSSAAGSWRDVDTEKLMEDIYHSREDIPGQ